VFYRFLGLKEVTKVVNAGAHDTGDKTIKEHHKLNETSKLKLKEYFYPFNALLDQFLGDTLGYNS
jgi:hypothetical protein